MSRSVPDNEMMDSQQSRDLGHATKSQPEEAKDAEKETPEERIEKDTRANRGLGTLIDRGEKSETEKALERGTEPPRR